MHVFYIHLLAAGPPYDHITHSNCISFRFLFARSFLQSYRKQTQMNANNSLIWCDARSVCSKLIANNTLRYAPFFVKRSKVASDYDINRLIQNPVSVVFAFIHTDLIDPHFSFLLSHTMDSHSYPMWLIEYQTKRKFTSHRAHIKGNTYGEIIPEDTEIMRKRQKTDAMWWNAIWNREMKTIHSVSKWYYTTLSLRNEKRNHVRYVKTMTNRIVPMRDDSFHNAAMNEYMKNYNNNKSILRFYTQFERSYGSFRFPLCSTNFMDTFSMIALLF